MIFNYIVLSISSALIGFIIGINWDKKNNQNNTDNYYRDFSKKAEKLQTKQIKQNAVVKKRKSESNVIQFKKNI